MSKISNAALGSTQIQQIAGMLNEISRLEDELADAMKAFETAAGFKNAIGTRLANKRIELTKAMVPHLDASTLPDKPRGIAVQG